MRTIHALVLGVVQGLTEFIPVSSTAHLYLVQSLLRIPNNAVTLSFDVVLHLGTLLALLLVTRRLLAGIAAELALWVSRRPARDRVSRALLLPLFVGTLPGALAGLFLLKRFEEIRTQALIGLSMVLASAYFLYAERRARNRFGEARDRSQIGLPDGLWMGVAQAAAGLLAGFSRSGLTISTGRARGLAREEAARFSFLLAVPIILGAGAKSLLDLRREPAAPIGRMALAAGFFAAASVGYLAARFLLRFLRTHDLRPFAIYLALLGATLLGSSFARHLPLVRSSGTTGAFLGARPPQTVSPGFRRAQPVSARWSPGSGLTPVSTVR